MSWLGSSTLCCGQKLALVIVSHYHGIAIINPRWSESRQSILRRCWLLVSDTDNMMWQCFDQDDVILKTIQISNVSHWSGWTTQNSYIIIDRFFRLTASKLCSYIISPDILGKSLAGADSSSLRLLIPLKMFRRPYHVTTRLSLDKNNIQLIEANWRLCTLDLHRFRWWLVTYWLITLGENSMQF